MSHCSCHSDTENHCETTHEHAHSSNIRTFLPVICSFVLLILGLVFEYLAVSFFKDFFRLLWYILAYLPVGIPILKESWEGIRKGDIFTEFFLMSIAGIGAFFIQEYAEGVAVLLFYTVGELFQERAVNKAKRSIKALLAVQAKVANVFRNGKWETVSPEEVEIGEKIQVKVGEKIPLDGQLLTEKAVVNTSALTGESTPNSLQQNAEVFAGSINLENVIEVVVTKKFADTSLARILDLVQNATTRKSKTELFIRKFARIYTPIVVFLAVSVVVLPYFFVADYDFYKWLYRSLVFLVISCPCALVISIPLGYFGGVGAGSRNGILFKGTSFLDTVGQFDTIVLDKTGTLTKGVFKVKEIQAEDLSENELMQYLLAMEKQSTHPIAKAIVAYEIDKKYTAENIEELAGLGLKGQVSGNCVLVGNKALLEAENVSVPTSVDEIVETTVLVAIGGKYAGFVVIADELKEDAENTITELQKVGIQQIVMLSGDKNTITQKVAKELGISYAKGDLLPQEKFAEFEKLQKNTSSKIAFVGDGINDAPVLALSDVGIAMGGLGSDVAIETADVIIQTDQPTKIVTAIRIGKATRSIIWQNIGLAFGVKVLVMVLGAMGIATMWEAVFADVGVALLAILNAVRLQRMQFEK